MTGYSKVYSHSTIQKLQRFGLAASIKQTMEQLNVPRKTLYDKMQRYQIDKDLYK
ncbi:hypothetical protein M892_05970 [Vibrio campbellii ATCC BAA-1116]|nr:hypothetical protein M892_05970 [Vibrio campbellii ATCC BAA-1116]